MKTCSVVPSSYDFFYSSETSVDLAPSAMRLRFPSNIGAATWGEGARQSTGSMEGHYDSVDYLTGVYRSSASVPATSHLQLDVQTSGHYETVGDQSGGARPSSNGRVAATVRAGRDALQQQVYEEPYERAEERPAGTSIAHASSSSHDTHYCNTERSRAGNYDQLAAQHRNTGDVHPYQQWSVARNGRDARTCTYL